MNGRLRTTLELLLVTLLGSPLLTPLLRWNMVPCTHDGHLHFHRVVAMLHAWRNGLYFSRWLPDLAFGYGYPFFLYREPLPLYLTLWPHLLGLPLPAAINLFYVLCLVAAGWFTFLWVRDVFDARAGVVAAVAYMAAPYQLIDALVRGNQVESLALALLPFILWAGRRFMLRDQARWFLASTLGLATLALSHNISLLLFTPALTLYLLFVGMAAGRRRKPILWRALLIVGLGLDMTAFYTVPAVLEIDEVTLTLSTSNRNNDFRFNFAGLGEILAPVTPEDPALINPPLPLRLGWAPAALALLGLFSLAWNQKREQRVHILFMAAGALLYLFFALPISEPLWEALPLIEFVQFPWRFVGRAALPVAVLAGAPFASGNFLNSLRLRVPLLTRGRLPLADSRFSPLVYGLLPVIFAIALVLIEAMPLLYPAYCVEEPYPTIHDVHEYEQSSGMVGVDPVGSYFPITVQQRPQDSPLLADYAAGRAPQRFDETTLPPGADVLSASYDPLHAQIEVQSPSAFVARYMTFDFPGWTASVDGQPVTITPADPTGLITFPVPAGRHSLSISWQLTPLRAALGVASGVAMLGALLAALFLWRSGMAPGVYSEQHASQAGHGPRPPGSRAARGLPYPAIAILAILALLFLGGKLLLLDRVPTPLRRSAPPPVSQETDLAAGGLRLAGYNLSREAVPSGGNFDIDLAWEVQATPALALQSNVWLRDAQGVVWSERETYRPRIYEDAPGTQQWQAGHWAWDSREVHVLSGTPPGRYQIVLMLFDLADLQPMTLTEGGSAVGPTAVIGEIEVLRPAAPPVFRPQKVLSQESSGLLLLGYNQDRDRAAPGDPLFVTLFWEKPAGGQPPPATVTLSLRDAADNVQREWQIAPVGETYDASRWQTGERLRGQHALRLPVSLNSGEYQLWLQDVAMGTLLVDAPQRLFDTPDFDRTVDRAFGGKARLLGYSLAPVDDLLSLHNGPPATLTVTLAWQALEEMEKSYRVFVHLVSEGGDIIAQSDAEPAQWARPTTGWAAGEFVLDEHVLALPAHLPAGDLALRVGLYDLESGARLRLDGGADFVLLQP